MRTARPMITPAAAATAEHSDGALRDPLTATPLGDPLVADEGESVQMDGGRAGAVKSTASQGVKGSAGSLPFLSQIQEAFGKHSVADVRAYTDDKAKDANAALGSHAYAKGDKIAFGEGGLNLHTVAHEATHIVQQRAGIKPPGGVGTPGDPLEQQADAVADEVVQGNSAESMLDRIAGG